MIDHTAKISKQATTTGYKKDTSHKGGKTKWVVLLIIALLVLLRAFLPYIVLRYVNNKMANLQEYYGHVTDIDIALYRGAYVIKKIELVKVDKEGNVKDTIPFFKCPAIDLSVEWHSLFKGAIVGELYVEEPVLNFSNGKHKNEDLKADTSDFRQLIKDLMPLTINHFEITNGQIHYLDNTTNPKIDVSMKDLEIIATNLSNVNDSAKVLPAHVRANGNAYEGTFQLDIDLDALNKIPTFDLNAELKNVNLVLLNDFLRAYGDFDVKKGRFGLYTEFAAKEGSFGGYVKPTIKDIEVVQWKGNIKQVLWEMLVGASAAILKNGNTEQVATKVPIEGRFDNPDINTWRAVSLVLRNAFVSALKPTIDNTINIHKLEDDPKKTFLEKIFRKDKKYPKEDKTDKHDKKNKNNTKK